MVVMDVNAGTAHHARVAARNSLRGLALGDGFGEQWFPRRNPAAADMIRDRRLPPAPVWHWTDDTAMALSVVRALELDGEIDPRHLAELFGAAYHADEHRQYGYGMHQLLPRLAVAPALWQGFARDLFEGQGSLGNGAAMRVAPLGAWFGADLDQAAEQAALSAAVTHAHPEGIAGAVAVAVAAAMAAAGRGESVGRPQDFLHAVARRTPAGKVHDGVLAAADLPPTASAAEAAELLGPGKRIRAEDTVPFALWSAARHLDDLVGALWCTAEGFGDVDTTCAITAGVVAARTGVGAVPAAWLERLEPLPEWTADETKAATV